MKVGADLESDDRRAALIRRALGPDGMLMMDANQVWGVDEAIAAMERLGAHDPWWIEEPTSPDDVLGHARIRREIAPIRVATGEHVQNRVDLQAAVPGARRSTSARSTPAGSAA